MKQVHVIKGKLPESLLELRRKVYTDEVGYLNDTRLELGDDLFSSHVVMENENGDPIASISLMPAERGEFADQSRMDPTSLTDSVFLTRCIVHPNYRKSGIFRLLTYCALHEARSWNRTYIVGFVEKKELAAQKVMGFEIDDDEEPYEITGKEGNKFSLYRVQFPIDPSLHRIAESIGKSSSADDLYRLHPGIIQRNLSPKIEEFFSTNQWFHAIEDRTLDRAQYMNALVNMYQFVKMTTRIIAQAVSLSHNKALRSHFIQHLQGEIDHEVQIEADLRHLGYDLDYLIDCSNPNPETLKFMLIQEAMLASRRDPTLYLAVPLCIEGISANVGPDFLENLEACIQGWGFQPRRASIFLRVHVEEDGGDDGHWQANLDVLEKVRMNERVFQLFQNTLSITMDAISESYNSYADVVEPQRGGTLHEASRRRRQPQHPTTAEQSPYLA